MTDYNAVNQIEDITPADYDFDHDTLTEPSLVQRLLVCATNAPELKVETRANGDRHFMMRCKGKEDESGWSMDDIADFILKPDSTIKHLFTGSDGSDESDWIFIGEDRHKQWESTIDDEEIHRMYSGDKYSLASDIQFDVQTMLRGIEESKDEDEPSSTAEVFVMMFNDLTETDAKELERLLIVIAHHKGLEDKEDV